MAEEFPRFQLGFEFLYAEKRSSVKESQNEAPVPKKKTVCRTDRSGEKPAFGGNASKVYEELDKLGSKRFQRYEFT